MPDPGPDFHRYLPMAGTDLNINIDRDSIDNPAETTFSAEAIDRLADEMMAWAISRLLRIATQHGTMPSSLHITVTMTADVSLDLDDPYPDLDFEWRSDTKAAEDPRSDMFSANRMTAMRGRIAQWLRDRLAELAILRDRHQPMPQALTLNIDVRDPRAENSPISPTRRPPETPESSA